MHKNLLWILSLLIICIFPAGCGGGGGTGTPTTTVTVRIAVTSATPIAALDFALVNTGTGTATYVANTIQVVPAPPSPNIAIVAANTVSGGTNVSFSAFPGIANPVFQAQFTTTGTVAFNVTNISATDDANVVIPLTPADFSVTIL